MKKLIGFVVLSTVLAIGCTSHAHQQLTARDRRVQRIDTSMLVGATAVGAMIEEQTR